MQTNQSQPKTRPRQTVSTGVLRLNARGFGFVNVDGGPDVFVPPKLLAGLLDDDTVTVTVREDEDQARRVELVTRARSCVVGTVNAQGGLDLDPGVGLGSVPVEGTTGLVGHAVIADVTPDGPWVLRSDLGPASSPQALTTRFMYRHQLPVGYSDEVLADAARTASRPAGVSLTSPARRDLTDQLVVTIDDDKSEDLDDALSAQGMADGSIRVWVHIADVAAHVIPGSAVDSAARATPTSIYLPQAVRHMLPPLLGASQLSLLPGLERDSVCVELRIDRDGAVRGVDVYEARIRSNQRINYATAAKVITGDDDLLDPDVAAMLRVLRTAAARLGVQRAARGGLDSARADQNDERGDDDEAHQLIERLMVATNEAVASWLTERGMPCLWRVHDPLGPDAAAELEVAAAGFGLYAGFGGSVSPQGLAAVVSQVPEGPAGAAFWDALLGALGRAAYSGTPGGHFGLGSNGYLHFTSPLRRYPDLLVHRIVKAYLTGDRDPARWESEIAEVAEVANTVFRRAAWAERDAVVFERLTLLRRGQVLNATVVGPARGGVRVRLDTNGSRGILTVDLPAGDPVQVRLGRVEPLCGRLELTTADAPATKRAPQRTARPARQPAGPSVATGPTPRPEPPSIADPSAQPGPSETSSRAAPRRRRRPRRDAA